MFLKASTFSPDSPAFFDIFDTDRASARGHISNRNSEQQPEKTCIWMAIERLVVVVVCIASYLKLLRNTTYPPQIISLSFSLHSFVICFLFSLLTMAIALLCFFAHFFSLLQQRRVFQPILPHSSPQLLRNEIARTLMLWNINFDAHQTDRCCCQCVLLALSLFYQFNFRENYLTIDPIHLRWSWSGGCEERWKNRHTKREMNCMMGRPSKVGELATLLRIHPVLCCCVSLFSLWWTSLSAASIGIEN